MTRLKEILQERELSVLWLAKEIGVTPTTGYNWTQGRSIPRDKQKQAISKLLGVSIEELFFSDNGGSGNAS